MTKQFSVNPERLTRNLAEVHERIEAAASRSGRQASAVELLVAAKYLPTEELQKVAEVGITLLGENRLQQLVEKQAVYPDLFAWDFIGHIQSRKVKEIVGRVRLIHSVASDSVLTQLAKHGTPETEILIEVNVAGEEGKDGIAPAQLGAFIERCPVTVKGLMTMPPYTDNPETNRRYFAALRELAQTHKLTELSMGTSQDFEVAVEEGATIVRLGSGLFS